MISCDANILICALSDKLEHHKRARKFLGDQISNIEFALSELVLMELYVLLRNPLLVTNPMSAEKACGLISDLRRNPKWTILKGTSDVSEHVWKVASTPQFPRRAIYDARIAYSLAAEGVTTFATNNVKDFRRFGVLDLFDPLSASDEREN